METTKIALFKGRQIRKTLYNGEWWFVVNDIIEALADSRDPAQYFKRLKQRDEELAKLTDKGGVQFVPPLMLDIKTQDRLGSDLAYSVEKTCSHEFHLLIIQTKIPFESLSH